MTRFVAFALLLGACAQTSDGSVTSYERGAGLCSPGGPVAYCAIQIDIADEGTVQLSSVNDPTLFGILTADGQAELADLVASLPIDTASDDSHDCADVPLETLHIDFDSVGDRAFHYACHPGPFSGFQRFFSDISDALLQGASDDRITVPVE